MILRLNYGWCIKINTFKPKTDLERLFFTTVKIIVKKTNGGKSVGTCFFFRYKFDSGAYKNKYSMFLITNRHVVENAKSVVLRFNNSFDNETVLIGNTFKIEIKEPWYNHSSLDLAILPFTPILRYIKDIKKRAYFQPITNEIIFTQAKNALINFIEDIFFIGYPRGIYDSYNNIPVIRKGINATPIIFDYNDLPVFLIDASVYPGSSGSPVFLCDSGGYGLKNKLFFGHRTLFLGILSRTFKNTEGKFLVNIDFKGIESIIEKTHLDLGIVIKPYIIIELIKRYLKEKELLS